MQKFERWLVDCLPSSWGKRLQQAHGDNKAILRSIFWLAIFVLGAKGIAAFKEVAIAYRYGTSEVLEGYLLVFNLANQPVSLLLTVMTSVLVPALVRARQNGTPNGLKWQRQITAWVWIAAVAMSALVAAVLPPMLSRGWLGLTHQGQVTAMTLLPALAAMVGLGIVAAWHACQLMSVQRHTNTFLESLPAMGILAAVLIWPAPGPDPLLWGTLAGFAVQAVVMAWVARAAGFPIRPAWPPGQPLEPALASNIGWLLATQALMGVTVVVDQIVLAHLPAGSLATYGYANRMMALILTLGTIVLGRALLPVLSGSVDRQWQYTLALNWARRAFWAGIMAAALLMLLAHSLVRVLFQRGAFTASDSTGTAQLLMLMALQLPLYMSMIVWVRWLLSQPRKGKVLWWGAVAGTVAKLTVMFVCIVGFTWGASAVIWGEFARVAAYSALLQMYLHLRIKE